MKKILQSTEQDAQKVDPFKKKPCGCDTIWVHITDGYGLADDLVECKVCNWTMDFGTLYKDIRMPQSKKMPLAGGK